MQLHGQNIVGNEISCCGGVPFRGVNPATGAELDGDFFDADAVEVDRAMRARRAAFDDYRARTPQERAAFLDRIGAEIDALGDALIDRAVAETGLGADRLKGERARTVNQLRMFARLLEEGSWVQARIDRADPRPQAAAEARPAADARAARAGRRVRGEQFPPGDLRRRQRHGLRPGRRVPGRREGPPGPPGHVGDGRRRRS